MKMHNVALETTAVSNVAIAHDIMHIDVDELRMVSLQKPKHMDAECLKKENLNSVQSCQIYIN